jgi:2-keto-4-pentenoate hydratase
MDDETPRRRPGPAPKYSRTMTAQERQDVFRAKRLAEGIRRIAVEVPEHEVEDFKRLAKQQVKLHIAERRRRGLKEPAV